MKLTSEQMQVIMYAIKHDGGTIEGFRCGYDLDIPRRSRKSARDLINRTHKVLYNYQAKNGHIALQNINDYIKKLLISTLQRT